MCAPIPRIWWRRDRRHPRDPGRDRRRVGGKTIIYLEPLAYAIETAGRSDGDDREEVFRATGPDSGAVIEVKLGAKWDGQITAAQSILKYQAGRLPESPAAGLHLRHGGL